MKEYLFFGKINSVPNGIKTKANSPKQALNNIKYNIKSAMSWDNESYKIDMNGFIVEIDNDEIVASKDKDVAALARFINVFNITHSKFNQTSKVFLIDAFSTRIKKELLKALEYYATDCFYIKEESGFVQKVEDVFRMSASTMCVGERSFELVDGGFFEDGVPYSAMLFSKRELTNRDAYNISTIVGCVLVETYENVKARS